MNDSEAWEARRRSVLGTDGPSASEGARMRRSRSWREPGASTGYVPAVNDSDHWENTRRTVRGEVVQPPVVRAQTTRHSLAARDLDAGGPSAARGRQPTTFLQQDEAGGRGGSVAAIKDA